ncbi:MAG TPA: hypothetical protein VM581_04040 [Magnetospirillaceae bacterium]|nr:hypothetical protein [Magnetospirillaceae bacterium]
MAPNSMPRLVIHPEVGTLEIDSVKRLDTRKPARLIVYLAALVSVIVTLTWVTQPESPIVNAVETGIALLTLVRLFWHFVGGPWFTRHRLLNEGRAFYLPVTLEERYQQQANRIDQKVDEVNRPALRAKLFNGVREILPHHTALQNEIAKGDMMDTEYCLVLESRIERAWESVVITIDLKDPDTRPEPNL